MLRGAMYYISFSYTKKLSRDVKQRTLPAVSFDVHIACMCVRAGMYSANCWSMSLNMCSDIPQDLGWLANQPSTGQKVACRILFVCLLFLFKDLKWQNFCCVFCVSVCIFWVNHLRSIVVIAKRRRRERRERCVRPTVADASWGLRSGRRRQGQCE